MKGVCQKPKRRANGRQTIRAMQTRIPGGRKASSKWVFRQNRTISPSCQEVVGPMAIGTAGECRKTLREGVIHAGTSWGGCAPGVRKLLVGKFDPGDIPKYAAGREEASRRKGGHVAVWASGPREPLIPTGRYGGILSNCV